jgi:hypothetical protein
MLIMIIYTNLCSFYSPFKNSQKVAEKICDFIIFENILKFDKRSRQLDENRDMLESKPHKLEKKKISYKRTFRVKVFARQLFTAQKTVAVILVNEKFGTKM